MKKLYLVIIDIGIMSKLKVALTVGQQEEVMKIMSEPNGDEILQDIMNDAKTSTYTQHIINLQNELHDCIRNTSIERKEKDNKVKSITKQIYKTQLYDSLGTILNNRTAKGLPLLPEAAVKKYLTYEPKTEDSIVTEFANYPPAKRKQILTTQMESPFSPGPTDDESEYKMLKEFNPSLVRGGKRRSKSKKNKLKRNKKRRTIRKRK